MAGLNPGQVKSSNARFESKDGWLLIGTFHLLGEVMLIEVSSGGGGLPEQGCQPAACGHQGGGGAVEKLGAAGFKIIGCLGILCFDL